MNFFRALEKLQEYIEQGQKKITELKKDLPILQELVNGSWTKERRLSELKTELASIDRKIKLSISPEPKKTVDLNEKQKENQSIVQTKSIHIPREV